MPGRPSHPQPLRFSVVICAWTEDRWNQLAAAIASVGRQTRPAWQTILAVDHCPPLARRAGRRLPRGDRGRQRRPAGAVRGPQHRAGPGHRRGGGVPGRRRRGRSRLAGAAGRRLHLSGGGRGRRGRAPGLGGRPPGWFPPEFDWVVGCSYTGLPRGREPVRNLIGANMSFRREVFDLVGGFSEGLGRLGTRPLGCEETELAIRIGQRRPGSRLLYDPSAVVHHLVPRQRARWRYFRARCYAEGRSKAMVSRLVGAGDALASERDYVRRVLPWAVVRGLVPRRPGSQPGLRTAATVLCGLACSTSGYLCGRLAMAAGRASPGRGATRRPAPSSSSTSRPPANPTSPR